MRLVVIAVLDFAFCVIACAGFASLCCETDFMKSVSVGVALMTFVF